MHLYICLVVGNRPSCLSVARGSFTVTGPDLREAELSSPLFLHSHSLAFRDGQTPVTQSHFPTWVPFRPRGC